MLAKEAKISNSDSKVVTVICVVVINLKPETVADRFHDVHCDRFAVSPLALVSIRFDCRRFEIVAVHVLLPSLAGRRLCAETHRYAWLPAPAGPAARSISRLFLAPL